MILTRDKGSRMWGGGGVSGGSGGGGGLDPSALAGYASMGWVDDNYVSKDYFNQLFKVKVAVRVLVTDPSTTPATVISDTTTVRQDLLYPNEVPESTTTTDEETGYVTSTTYSIDSIQVMGGVWTNSYVSALGQNSSGGGGGGGGSLNEPLSSINMAGLSAPGAAQDGKTVVWNQATGRWVYGSTGSGTVTSITAGTGLSGGTITGSGTIAIDSAYQTYISHGETAYGWGNHANAGYATQSWVNNQNFLTQTVGDGRYLTISFFRSLFRAYNSSGTEVQPNTGDTATIDNIKAMFGFWTNAYISALGQNSSGGGGGGSSTLAGLNDVALDPDPLTPANTNDVLSYNGNGHWVNVSKASFLSGYVTTSDISDMATKTWVTSQNYLTGITSSMVTTALGFTPMNSTVTFWGQSVNNGVVNGSMTSVGNITFDGSEARRISPNGTALFIGNSDNANWVYMADMASQSGDSYWKIYSSGYAHFKRLYLDANVYLEYDSTNGGVQLVGAGFYTSSYVSALGANSSGGGGGGSSTLAGLSDVALDPDPLTSANANDVLSYNGNGHWINVSKSSFLSGYVTTSDISDMATKTWVGLQGYLTSVAFSDLTSHPTTLSGYGITDAKIASGIITLGNNTITPWTASNHPTTLSGYGITDAYISGGTIYLGSNSITPVTTETDPTVPAWAKESTKPSYSFSELTSHPTTLSGYGITDAVNSSTTFWGQSVSNGVVQGSIEAGANGGAITGFHSIELNSNGTLSGYGGFIDFHFNGSSSDYTSRIIEDANGRLFMDADNGVRIGNAVLKWDSTNNALYVQRSDGSAANLYATGGVSALGMSAGTSGVDAMTFNYVTINNELRLKNGTYTGSVFVDSNHNLCLSSSSGVIGTLGNTLYTEGGGIDTEDGDINAGGGTIITTGNVQAARFYLDGTRYLYVSNGTLYYYNGTTSKQVAFTN